MKHFSTFTGTYFGRFEEVISSCGCVNIDSRYVMTMSNFHQIKYIEDIQIFGMNMPFISSSEAKNAYFMSGEATNEIYIFSLHEMK